MVKKVFLSNQIFDIDKYNEGMKLKSKLYESQIGNHLELNEISEKILKSTRFSNKTNSFNIWNICPVHYEKSDFEEWFGQHSGFLTKKLAFPEDQNYDKTKFIRENAENYLAIHVTNVSKSKSNSRFLYLVGQDLKKMRIYLDIKNRLANVHLEKPKFYGFFSDLQVGDYVVYKDFIKTEDTYDHFRAQVVGVEYTKSKNGKSKNGETKSGETKNVETTKREIDITETQNIEPETKNHVKSIKIVCVDLDFRTLWVDPKTIFWMPKELEEYPPVAIKLRINRRRLKIRMSEEYGKLFKVKTGVDIVIGLKQKSKLAKNLFYADFQQFYREMKDSD